MKATINAPYSVLHERNCEIIKQEIVLRDNDAAALCWCMVDGHPNMIPIRAQELKLVGGKETLVFPQS